MTRMTAVWRKEFKSYWYSPIAYIVITVFLVILTWFFFRGFYLVNNANMRDFFAVLPWAFLFLMPAVTMRQWAEERKSGTLETLMTKPLSEWEVVIGKYLATVALLVVILLLTLPLTFSVAGLSQAGLDWGVVFANYLGALLLGMAYLALGGWASCFTQNQIVAFILGLAIIFVLMVLGLPVVTVFSGVLAPLLRYISIGEHFTSLARGVIDTRDLVYYVSVVFLSLYLTVRTVESRKWG